MYHASAFQTGDRHQSHVCVVCAWLKVGELPGFDNQPQDLAALFLRLVKCFVRQRIAGPMVLLADRFHQDVL